MELPRLGRVLQRLLEGIVLLLMGSLALIVVAGVVLRKIGAPLVWYDEVASQLLAWLTFYGASLAAFRHAHIGYPGLLRISSTRLRRLLIVLREAFVIGFFALLAWAGWTVMLVLDGSSLISLPWITTRVTHSVVVVGAALFICAELCTLPARLAGKVDLEEGLEEALL